MLFLFQTKGCDGDSSVSEIRPVTPVVVDSTSKPSDYKLTTKDCFAEKRCFAFIGLKKNLQDERGLVEITTFLGKNNPNKVYLVIYYFDNFNTAQSFAEGKVHLTELEFYAIGVYRYDEKEEYLKMRIIDPQAPDPPERPKWRTVFKRPIK